MIPLRYIPQSEFTRIRNAALDEYQRLALLADMCRFNTLVSVKRAGSGHLGSSLSSLDIVTYLYFKEMNVATLGIDHPDRDIYYSSKGHDAPGLYSVFYALGILPLEQWMNLRRQSGPCGHPDVSIPGVEANTGSLGMGISKAKGIAIAKQLSQLQGRLFVMTGDGELQEGQIYESLQTAAHQKIANLRVFVDHNKVQSDKPVSEIINLGCLKEKFRSFGWYVTRCDGHSFQDLERACREFDTVTDKPKIAIADTLKGRGVSFMEHPTALAANQGLYRWHAGAPDDDTFLRAQDELFTSIQSKLPELGLLPLTVDELPAPQSLPVSAPGETVAAAFGKALADLSHDKVVVISADLAGDCQLREFEKRFPERFIENGIAEQDAVSMAGGLALQGFLPVIASFASFLAARPNEQIYTNSTERTRIVYAFHYAGLIPAGPGHSHQSVRDISLMASLPSVTILQPCNPSETRMAVDYCLNHAQDTCVLRMNLGPSPRAIELPQDYEWKEGRGAVLTEGAQAVVFAYGPVLLAEALAAAEILMEEGLSLCVVNMPWLNRVDHAWLRETVQMFEIVLALDDHSPVGGLGDSLLNALNETRLLHSRTFIKRGIEGVPMWGTLPEALRHHRLDRHSIAQEIHDVLGC